MSNGKSQYNGQNGNGYQPLPCAPTPPPGPEVGSPTLADVQPGGRVRLGGLLPEDVAQALAAVNEVANDARHAGNYRVANALVTARVTLSKQLLALSAQSSPGGQGVGVSISDDDRAVLQRLQDALPTAGINGWAKGVEVLERLLRDSLAARQPAGEPARLPSHTVDGELSVASAIDQVLELFPTSGRAALQTLAGLLTHPTIYRYVAPPAQAMDLAPAPVAIPDTPGVRDILGRPNFWCSPWANILRRRGDVIPCKAEEEQAAVILFMLNHYLAHGEGWAEAAEAELQSIRYQVVRNG
ncbi:hypothetical protein [Stenotrophomonas maltophilia]|uniref:Uncharacterized protein n=1 Tax=Stenotrophomonas maltophilia TaxID=40324 RepID=A0AAJ2TKR9_STEMA|nr:hypothetical protein [Stenotrophomonas maltophilia]MDZ5764123.1 hypothetical protein [Stenotrophomonas maltophilia]